MAKKKGVYGDFALQQPWLQNEENLSTFPISNLCKKSLIVPVNFFEWKMIKYILDIFFFIDIK